MTDNSSGFKLGLMSSKRFNAARFEADWLIKEIMVSGQPAVIGGPRKSLKTTLACDLAISLGTGTPFLGRFDVPKKRRVAVISGESGQAVLQQTARRICTARGIECSDNCDVLWSPRLPLLTDPQHLAVLRHELKKAAVEVVILDPLYLSLMGVGESIAVSNLYEVGPVLRRVTEDCLAIGAMPIFVHHSTKAANKKSPAGSAIPELDDLAFAGIAEFVRQWLLIARSVAYTPGSGHHELVLAVGGSAGHSTAWRLEIDEGHMDSRLLGRTWRVHVHQFGEPDHFQPWRRESGKERRCRNVRG